MPERPEIIDLLLQRERDTPDDEAMPISEAEFSALLDNLEHLQMQDLVDRNMKASSRAEAEKYLRMGVDRFGHHTLRIHP